MTIGVAHASIFLLRVHLASSVCGCIMVVETRGARCGTMGNGHSPPMAAYLSSHAHPRTFALSLSLTTHALGHRYRRRGCPMHTLLSPRPVCGAAPAASPPDAVAARRQDQRFVCWSLETARPRAADPRLHRSPMRRGAVTTRYRST